MLQDIRLAIRLLWRARVASAVALFSIVLSVGATSVVFTAVKAVLLDRLPYARPEELVQLRSEYPNFEASLADWVIWSDAQEVIRRTHTLTCAGIWRNAIFNLAGDGSSTPESLYGLRVSPDLLPTLGVRAMLGRSVLPENDSDNVIILSHGLWKRRFNADRGAVGRHLKIDGRDVEVIGVMPEDFSFPLRRAAVHTPAPYSEFWAPMGAGPRVRTGAMGMVARLAPGVTARQAQQDVASIGAALAREFPATNRDHTLGVSLLRDRIVGRADEALWLLMAASIMFLLIGCANVASLLLARGLVRQREIAIRTAIGAPRARLVRQLLTESCVLALAGGLGGYALTVAAWRVLPALSPVSIPRLASAHPDGAVLGFALAVAVLNGLLFGIVPAIRAVTAAGLSARGAAAGARDGIRGSLVAAEVAITVALAVIGGQFLGSFLELAGTDPGFQADRVLACVLLAAPERYRTPQQRGAFYSKVLEAVKRLPGVEAAGTADALPFSGENHGGPVAATQADAIDPRRQTPAEVDVVSAGYLPAMGVRLAAGRLLEEHDMDGSSDAAMVSDALARRLWPGADPVGRQICLYCTPENPRNWKRVIGVVTTVRHRRLDEPEPYSVYLAQSALEKGQFLVVKTGRPAAEMDRAIRHEIAAIDPEQPLFFSVPMRVLVADSVADRRFLVVLLVATGGLALLLAVGGVYGVVSYATSRRTQEIGVRMALGASPGSVQALVFRQGFFHVGLGLAIGLGATLAAQRILRSALASLTSGKAVQIAIAMGLVSVAAALACWVPARRAASVDPMLALREE
ncbi:MAG TPA: ABC transporter permease [Candidatus Acidoferrales bacterium]|nr:ABC transporter permease [Candidatus Acidoferrales bacterium]